MVNKHISLRKDRKALSPALSTMILTSAIVVMILVAMAFANGFLNTNMAQNEFSSNKNFMQSAGLQIDDIAWTIGRTQTVTYSSNFGTVHFEPLAVNYTFQVHYTTGSWGNLTTGVTGIILFNMPVSSYSVGKNYFERVPTSANNSILLSGSSAPVCQVICEEKQPMADGSYTRIAAVPTIRMLNSTITGTQNQVNYFKFYLPILQNGTSRYLSQSLSMTGNGITKVTENGVDQVRISVNFPQATAGFDSSFFNFKQTNLTIALPPNSVAEFYIGTVLVTIGSV